MLFAANVAPAYALLGSCIKECYKSSNMQDTWPRGQDGLRTLLLKMADYM